MDKRKSMDWNRSFYRLGVCIGKAAIVGATASVYKSVKDYNIVGGNPATILKIRNLNIYDK